PPSSGSPSGECDFQFFAAIVATFTPLTGAGCSTVDLGSVAGEVVEPVLYLPLSIYLVYVNYITTGALTPQRDIVRLFPGRGRRLRPIVNDKGRPAPNQSPGGCRGSTFADRKTCSFALALSGRRLRRVGAFCSRQLL